MLVYRATNSENAIKVTIKSGEMSNADQLIEQTIAEIFGSKNGDYFTHSSRIVQDVTKSRTFKIFLIEDKDGVKHSVFFEYIKETNENKTTPKTFGCNTQRYI